MPQAFSYLGRGEGSGIFFEKNIVMPYLTEKLFRFCSWKKKLMLSPARKKILCCWIWADVFFLWKNVFLIHMIGKQSLAFLLMRKTIFWLEARFWKQIDDHNENPSPLILKITDQSIHSLQSLPKNNPPIKSHAWIRPGIDM